ncbi:MAG: hypothetical protein ACRD1P_04865 [Thermoanaerobaculia bacterium]
MTLARYTLLERLAAGTFVAVFGALLIYNQSLRTRCQQLISARGDPQATEAEPLSTGDSILRFQFLTEAENPISPTLLLGRPATIFYFFKRGCPTCEAQSKDWVDYFALYGYDDVVFISTDLVRSSKEWPGVEPQRLRSFRLVRDRAARARIRFVPQIVLIDSCGIVRGNFRSVRNAAEALRRASEPTKSSGRRDTAASPLA